jgi:hypothetical protein
VKNSDMNKETRARGDVIVQSLHTRTIARTSNSFIGAFMWTFGLDAELQNTVLLESMIDYDSSDPTGHGKMRITFNRRKNCFWLLHVDATRFDVD